MDTVTVLAVDDDRWTTRAIAAALGDDPGITVVAKAHSGEEAPEAFLRHRPDVVLMDINMPPGISGVEATGRILRQDPDARIVILTTISPGPGIARALEAGAIAAVNKTADDNLLRAVVKQAATGEDPWILKQLAQDIIVSGDPLPEAPRIDAHITEREKSILIRICEGLSYQEIADAETIAVWTVKTHAGRLREKLQAQTMAQLIVRALQYKFYTPE